MDSLLQQLNAHRGPLAIGAGLVLLIVGLTEIQVGVLTGFGLIALGATWSLSRKRPMVVWVHLGVYLMLYGLFAGAVLSGEELATTPLERVLLRLDFAGSFLLMAGVCKYSLPVLLEELGQEE